MKDVVYISLSLHYKIDIHVEIYAMEDTERI